MSDALRAKVAKVARSWVGTPFYPHGTRKGVGVDCVQLALAVYKDSGLLPPDAALPQSYTLGAGEHLASSAVLAWLSSSPHFAPESGWPSVGDLVVFRFGKVEHHVGVMVDAEHFVHAIRDYGVIEVSLRDGTWSKRLRGSWRVSSLKT